MLYIDSQTIKRCASGNRLNYLITNILHGIHCKLLAIIRLGYFLFLSFVYCIFRAFADVFLSFAPRLFLESQAEGQILVPHPKQTFIPVKSDKIKDNKQITVQLESSIRESL